MADNISKKKRSYVMSRIRGKDSQPEKTVRGILNEMGLAFETYLRVGKVRVDIAVPDGRVAIMVDGCFWHGCPRCYREPKSNVDFWRAKLEDNRERDRKQDAVLKEEGWEVLRVWEHELAPRNLGRFRSKLRRAEISRYSHKS